MPRDLTVNNPKIQQILNDTQLLPFSQAPGRARGFNIDDYERCSKWATSEGMLRDKLADKDVGFRIEYSYNAIVGESEGGAYLFNKLKPLTDFDEYYTSGYDPRGFVGWHSDGDIGGWYIMMTYNSQGQGFFRYYDKDTDSVVTMPDTPGWMVRAMELPNDPERVFWHCAAADSPRFTFILLFKDHAKFVAAVKLFENSHG